MPFHDLLLFVGGASLGFVIGALVAFYAAYKSSN